ncbi:hypothetical protein F5X68DRAFT_278178 [Plectosphaerella plurivora]|uniref:Uncharacterized protein n=1 Tax=Plectosphaerella plurivora TaxID=936078 RepID=A0A9P9A978_9PEZI|nr:hypothetical protein F5X68DRAFT_278178 [Plectosphaerella plurivora]
MGTKYVVGDSSPFLKRVLIPFWVVRIAIMCLYIVIYGLALIGLSAYGDEVNRELRNSYNTSIELGPVIAIIAVILIIVLFCLILDIVCIIKRGRRTLNPRFFLIVNVIQTTIWTVLFALSMVGARTGTTIAIGVIVYLSFAGMLIYASVMFHKHRKGTLGGAPGGYKPTQQNDLHTFDPNANYGYGQANAQPYQPAPYAPQDYNSYQQKPTEPYQQQPPYGYPQQGEAHEMHRPQH